MKLQLSDTLEEVLRSNLLSFLIHHSLQYVTTINILVLGVSKSFYKPFSACKASQKFTENNIILSLFTRHSVQGFYFTPSLPKIVCKYQ